MKNNDLKLPNVRYSLPDPDPISMDAYLEFVMFNIRHFNKGQELDRSEPVKERFVLD